MSEDLTVTYSGLSADERRVIINDKRAVRLRHGCAITERRALDRTASELQDTCHKQAQRIEVLEQAVAVPLIRKLVAALEGYRRNHNDTQPCDAEREGRAWLEGKP